MVATMDQPPVEAHCANADTPFDLYEGSEGYVAAKQRLKSQLIDRIAFITRARFCLFDNERQNWHPRPQRKLIR